MSFAGLLPKNASKISEFYRNEISKPVHASRHNIDTRISNKLSDNKLDMFTKMESMYSYDIIGILDKVFMNDNMRYLSPDQQKFLEKFLDCADNIRIEKGSTFRDGKEITIKDSFIEYLLLEGVVIVDPVSENKRKIDVYTDRFYGKYYDLKYDADGKTIVEAKRTMPRCFIEFDQFLASYTGEYNA